MKTIFQCAFCRHKFSRKLKSAYQEIRCPKCREYDVDIIGTERS